mgnify:CR=1 FL=1
MWRRLECSKGPRLAQSQTRHTRFFSRAYGMDRGHHAAYMIPVLAWIEDVQASLERAPLRHFHIDVTHAPAVHAGEGWLIEIDRPSAY